MSNIDQDKAGAGFLSRAWERSKVAREQRALRMAAPYLLAMTDEQLRNIGYNRDKLRSLL